MTIDPNNWILNQVGTITKDQTLSIKGIALRNVTIAPNPSNTMWNVSNIPDGATLQVEDITGKVLWQYKSAFNKTVSINTNAFSKGIYLLHITAKNQGESAIYKLVKMD